MTENELSGSYTIGILSYERLEGLQVHENVEIYERAVRLIENYFNGEEEVLEAENTVPTAADNTFSFGLPPPQTFGKQQQHQNFSKGFSFGDQNASSTAAVPQTFHFGEF